MSQNTKILFFDIDGTLVDFGGNMPESTIFALKELQSKGHKIFIATGRCYSQIYKFLLEFGFDGVVAGDGAYVEYRGEIIREVQLGTDGVRKMVEYLEKKGMIYILMGAHESVGPSGAIKALTRLFFGEENADVSFLGEFFADFYEAEDLLTHPEKYGHLEKGMIIQSTIPLWQADQEMAPEFSVSFTSVAEDERLGGDVIIRGVHKAYGMQVAIEALGMTREDTIAFGDGPNDLQMLEYAGIGIAMGNSSDRLKSVADMVTADVGDDGIYKALQELGLVE